MGGWLLRPADPSDAGELLVVGLAAFVTEAQRYDDPHLPPLRETLDEVRAALVHPALRVVVAEAGARDTGGEQESSWRPGRLLGGIRVALDAVGASGDGAVRLVGRIGRLVVVPDARGSGLGADLLAAAEDAAAAAGADRVELFTGVESAGALRLYVRAGYVETGRQRDDRGIDLVVLSKPVDPAAQ